MVTRLGYMNQEGVCGFWLTFSVLFCVPHIAMHDLALYQYMQETLPSGSIALYMDVWAALGQVPLYAALSYDSGLERPGGYVVFNSQFWYVLASFLSPCTISICIDRQVHGYAMQQGISTRLHVQHAFIHTDT